MKSAIGELSTGEEISQHATRQAYRVSIHVAKEAIAWLRAAGILGKYGRATNVNPRYLVERRNATQHGERILQLVATHVANLESMELGALAGRLETERCVRERPERST
jgi:DNA-binding GntR family transcriptional regulator